jgi:hypothetical protein
LADPEVHLADVAPGAVCSTCRLVHQRCKAHKRGSIKAGTPTPCMGYKIPGLQVCYFHGGHTKVARAAAARHVALAKAGELLGVPQEVDPGQALVDAVHEAAGNVEFLRNQLQAYQLGGGELGRVTAGDQLVINATLQLYNQERDRLADYCRLAIQAGVGERMVRVAERQGAMLAGLVAALLADPTLALTSQQQAIGRQVAHRLMTAHVALPASSQTQNGPLVQDSPGIEAEKSSGTL